MKRGPHAPLELRIPSAAAAATTDVPPAAGLRLSLVEQTVSCRGCRFNVSAAICADSLAVLSLRVYGLPPPGEASVAGGQERAGHNPTAEQRRAADRAVRSRINLATEVSTRAALAELHPSLQLRSLPQWSVGPASSSPLVALVWSRLCDGVKELLLNSPAPSDMAQTHGAGVGTGPGLEAYAALRDFTLKSRLESLRSAWNETPLQQLSLSVYSSFSAAHSPWSGSVGAAFPAILTPSPPALRSADSNRDSTRSFGGSSWGVREGDEELMNDGCTSSTTTARCEAASLPSSAAPGSPPAGGGEHLGDSGWGGGSSGTSSSAHKPVLDWAALAPLMKSRAGFGAVAHVAASPAPPSRQVSALDGSGGSAPAPASPAAAGGTAGFTPKQLLSARLRGDTDLSMDAGGAAAAGAANHARGSAVTSCGPLMAAASRGSTAPWKLEEDEACFLPPPWLLVTPPCVESVLSSRGDPPLHRAMQQQQQLSSAIVAAATAAARVHAVAPAAVPGRSAADAAVLAHSSDAVMAQSDLQQQHKQEGLGSWPSAASAAPASAPFYSAFSSPMRAPSSHAPSATAFSSARWGRRPVSLMEAGGATAAAAWGAVGGAGTEGLQPGGPRSFAAQPASSSASYLSPESYESRWSVTKRTGGPAPS